MKKAKDKDYTFPDRSKGEISELKPAVPNEILKSEQQFREWAKLWHGECKQKDCDIAKAIANNSPIEVLYNAVIETDDGWEESWKSYHNPQPQDNKELFTGGDWFVNWSGHPDNGRIQIGTPKDFIAEMYSNDEEYPDEDYISLEEAKANAALIAAAPAMYRAIKELLDSYDERSGNYHFCQDSDCIVKLKSILQKANPKQ